MRKKAKPHVENQTETVNDPSHKINNKSEAQYTCSFILSKYNVVTVKLKIQQQKSALHQGQRPFLHGVWFQMLIDSQVFFYEPHCEQEKTKSLPI